WWFRAGVAAGSPGRHRSGSRSDVGVVAAIDLDPRAVAHHVRPDLVRARRLLVDRALERAGELAEHARRADLGELVVDLGPRFGADERPRSRAVVDARGDVGRALGPRAGGEREREHESGHEGRDPGVTHGNLPVWPA